MLPVAKVRKQQHLQTWRKIHPDIQQDSSRIYSVTRLRKDPPVKQVRKSFNSSFLVSPSTTKSFVIQTCPVLTLMHQATHVEADPVNKTLSQSPKLAFRILACTRLLAVIVPPRRLTRQINAPHAPLIVEEACHQATFSPDTAAVASLQVHRPRLTSTLSVCHPSTYRPHPNIKTF